MCMIHMNIEKLDYLFGNYSKEEITKFGLKFGDINLKNNWQYLNLSLSKFKDKKYKLRYKKVDNCLPF